MTGGVSRGALACKVTEKVLNKVIFEHSTEGSEWASRMNFWGKYSRHRGK